MANPDVLYSVEHYQRSILKNADNEERLMHCLKKLQQLPITMEHLQKTGVGKTVNALRKLDSAVSKAANDLVTLWKKVVMEEELALEMSKCDSPHKVNECNGQQAAEKDINQPMAKNETFDSENKSECNGLAGETYTEMHTIRKEREISERKHKDKKKRNKSKERHSSKNTHENGASSKHKSSMHENKPQDAIDQNRIETNTIKSQEKEDSAQHESKEGHERKHKHSSSSEKERNKEHSHHRDKHRSKTDDGDKNDNDNKNEYVDKDPKHRNKTEESNKDEKQRMKTDNVEKDQKHSTKKDYVDKDEHRSSKKRKHEDNSDGEQNNDEELKLHKSKKEKKHKSMSASSSHKHHKEHKSHHKAKRSSEERSKEDPHKQSTSSEHKKPIDQSNDADTIQPKTGDNDLDNDGIDSSMGANFADVLGMLNVPVKKSKKSLNIKSSTSPQKAKESSTTRSHATSGNSNGIKSTTATSEAPSTSTSSSCMKNKPELLTSSANLAPLDPSIVLDLPIISNNYKPLPVNPTVMDCVYNTSSSTSTAVCKPPVRTMTDSEALTHSISSKTMRTKIYSGSKTGQVFQVPTLFDICIRILQKNLDALEYTGGVPFELLRPVIERCTPQQLFAFEEYNPYIMEDSDVLWKQHVQRQYRTERRQEMESWREMYFRCQEHKELKLSQLAENIKKSQKQIAAPVRKTQLAFVDSLVKPPRNVLRKQEQFGTKAKLIATPAARVAALSVVTPNAAKTGDARLRVSAAVRDHAQVSSSTNRVKKAPLMAKTLQLMRGRHKR